MNLQKIKAGFQKTINKLDKLEKENNAAISESQKAVQFHTARQGTFQQENIEARRFRDKLESLVS